jgi:hypothetical protein
MGVFTVAAGLLGILHLHGLSGGFGVNDVGLNHMVRAKAISTQTAGSLAGIFHERSGIGFSECDGGLRVAFRLPEDGGYARGVGSFRRFLRVKGGQASIVGGGAVRVRGEGFNLSRQGGRILMGLDALDGIEFDAAVEGNVTACELDFEPGDSRIQIRAQGDYGRCIISGNANLSGGIMFDGGCLSIDYSDNILGVDSECGVQANITLSGVKGYPLALDALVEARLDGVRQAAGVFL